MNTGKTKWFDKKKGYGFITRDDGKDFFVHYKNINVTGFKTLEPEQAVTFDVKEDTKGPQAVNVTPTK